MKFLEFQAGNSGRVLIPDVEGYYSFSAVLPSGASDKTSDVLYLRVSGSRLLNPLIPKNTIRGLLTTKDSLN